MIKFNEIETIQLSIYLHKFSTTVLQIENFHEKINPTKLLLKLYLYDMKEPNVAYIIIEN